VRRDWRLITIYFNCTTRNDHGGSDVAVQSRGVCVGRKYSALPRRRAAPLNDLLGDYRAKTQEWRRPTRRWPGCTTDFTHRSVVSSSSPTPSPPLTHSVLFRCTACVSGFICPGAVAMLTGQYGRLQLIGVWRYK